MSIQTLVAPRTEVLDIVSVRLRVDTGFTIGDFDDTPLPSTINQYVTDEELEGWLCQIEGKVQLESPHVNLDDIRARCSKLLRVRQARGGTPAQALSRRGLQVN